MVPVIVFAIVQGLDEFRNCIPKFLESFTQLRQFLLIDMVECVTIHMRDSHIEEIRLQHIHDQECECVEEMYEKQKISPNQIKTHFIEKNEKLANHNQNNVDIQPQIANDKEDIFDYQSNKSMVNDKQEIIKYQGDKSITRPNEKIHSRMVGNSNLLNNLKCENYEILNTKVGTNYFNNIENEKLSTKVENVWDVKNKYEAHDLIGNKIRNVKDKSQVNVFKQRHHVSQNDLKIYPSKCKRCENLNTVGKIGPCWTCVNKSKNNIIFQNMKSQDFKCITLDGGTNYTFGNESSLKENINENKEFETHLHESKRDIHSLQLKTFNNLFSIPKEIEYSNSSNLVFLKGIPSVDGSSTSLNVT